MDLGKRAPWTRPRRRRRAWSAARASAAARPPSGRRGRGRAPAGSAAAPRPGPPPAPTLDPISAPFIVHSSPRMRTPAFMRHMLHNLQLHWALLAVVACCLVEHGPRAADATQCAWRRTNCSCTAAMIQFAKVRVSGSRQTSSFTGALKPRSSDGTGRSVTSVNTKSCFARSRSSTSVVGALPFSWPCPAACAPMRAHPTCSTSTVCKHEALRSGGCCPNRRASGMHVADALCSLETPRCSKRAPHEPKTSRLRQGPPLLIGQHEISTAAATRGQ